MNADALARSFLNNLLFVQGRSLERATVNDLYMALAHTVRDRLISRWISTVKNYRAQDVRVVCYLSAEFLTGPHLANNLINLGIYDETAQAMRQLGLHLETLIEQEEDPGLGNGGLGRLAACFMDSLATLDIPAIGYGIRYEYGIFDQQIRDGWQVETADKWLRLGNPWALERPEDAVEIKLGGHTERVTDASRCAGFPSAWCAEFPTIRRFWATTPTPPTPCACGRRRQSRASTLEPSILGTLSARYPTK
jgi:starch phosphorylase